MFVELNIFLDLSIYKIIIKFYNLSYLRIVYGLKCKKGYKHKRSSLKIECNS
jgi:hypothetical protein